MINNIIYIDNVINNILLSSIVLACAYQKYYLSNKCCYLFGVFVALKNNKKGCWDSFEGNVVELDHNYY